MNKFLLKAIAGIAVAATLMSGGAFVTLNTDAQAAVTTKKAPTISGKSTSKNGAVVKCGCGKTKLTVTYSEKYSGSKGTAKGTLYLESQYSQTTGSTIKTEDGYSHKHQEEWHSTMEKKSSYTKITETSDAAYRTDKYSTKKAGFVTLSRWFTTTYGSIDSTTKYLSNSVVSSYKHTQANTLGIITKVQKGDGVFGCCCKLMKSKSDSSYITFKANCCGQQINVNAKTGKIISWKK